MPILRKIPHWVKESREIKCNLPIASGRHFIPKHTTSACSVSTENKVLVPSEWFCFRFNLHLRHYWLCLDFFYWTGLMFQLCTIPWPTLWKSWEFLLEINEWVIAVSVCTFSTHTHTLKHTETHCNSKSANGWLLSNLLSPLQHNCGITAGNVRFCWTEICWNFLVF